MIRSLTFLPLALLLSACAKSLPPPTPADVSRWADVNVAYIPPVPSADWEALLISARIPSEYAYPKSRLDFNGGKDPVFDIEDWNWEMVKNTGIASSVADFCKLDYEALNYFPMMDWQRSQLPDVVSNGYEIYVLGFAHGYAMGKTDQWLETNGMDCAGFEKAFADRFFSEVFGTEFESRSR